MDTNAKQKQNQNQNQKQKQTQPPKRPLILDAHVIAYLGDYMNNLKESLKHTISNMTQPPSSQSNTLSSHRKS